MDWDSLAELVGKVCLLGESVCLENLFVWNACSLCMYTRYIVPDLPCR